MSVEHYANVAASKRSNSAFTKRSVWIIARPLSKAFLFPPFAATSEGKFSLNHWGVLVTEFDVTAIRAILLRKEPHTRSLSNINLGALFELDQDRFGTTTARQTADFGTDDVSREWQRVCAAYMGVTHQSNGEIEIEGQGSSTSALICQGA
jgi:hypothetical protein